MGKKAQITYRPKTGDWLVWCFKCDWETVVGDENAAIILKQKHKH